MRDLLGLAGIAATTTLPVWAAALAAAAITFAIVYRRVRRAKYEVLPGSLNHRRR